MINKRYNNLLQSTEYNFLKNNNYLNDNICLLGLGGSRAYGTNLPDSDIDIRGIAVRRKEDILLGKDFESIVDIDTDTTIYSLDKIFELLSNCNPNTIELLGLEKNDYLYINEIGKMILDNKNIFLSNKCVDSFNGYATSQLYRLQQKTNTALTEEELNKHISKVLNNMLIKMYDKYDFNKGDISFYVENKIIKCNIHKDNIDMNDLAGILSECNNTLRDYRKTSKRNEHAFTHNKIAKHSMHLLRLYMMGIDLVSEGKIQTKRAKEHSLLMDIRNGLYLDERGIPNKEFFDIVKDYQEKFEKEVTHSILPDKPDMDKINKLRSDINEMVIFDNIKNKNFIKNKQLGQSYDDYDILL